MTFILPSFGASAISAVPGGGGSAWDGNTYSLEFDGTDDYMSAAVTELNGISAFSASIWFRFQGSLGGAANIIMSGGDGTSANTESWYVWLKDTTTIQYASQGSNAKDFNITVHPTISTINNSTWYHLTVVHSGTSATLYLDGSSLGTQTVNALPSSSGNAFNIGRWSPGANYHYNGYADEVSLFDSALSASDVTSIYNRGGPDDLASLNPVGWWRMGDTGSDYGTATITNAATGSNSGGSSINASIENGSSGNTSPTYSTDVPVAPIANSYALSLDGTDDYVALGNSSDLAPSNITVSLWFKASGTVGTYNYLFAREGALYGSYLLRYTSANKFNIFIGHAGGSTTDITSSSTYTLTDWHHVAFTYDQTNLKLYVDGSEAASVAKTTAIDYTPSTSYGTDNTYIGKGTFADNTEGLIDEVAIFNSALSASQITNIYRGEDDGGSGGTNGVPGDLSTFNSNNGPVGWWRMGDNNSGAGATITDQGSGGNDGTIENGSSGNTSPTYHDLSTAPDSIYVA